MQIVRGVSVGIRDASVPTSKACACFHRCAQSRELGFLDGVHGVALHDEVNGPQVFCISVDGCVFLDPHAVAVALQMRDEKVGRLDGLVTIPAAADHEGVFGRHEFSF